MKHVHPIARLPRLQGSVAAVVLLLSLPSQAAAGEAGALIGDAERTIAAATAAYRVAEGILRKWFNATPAARAKRPG